MPMPISKWLERGLTYVESECERLGVRMLLTKQNLMLRNSNHKFSKRV